MSDICGPLSALEPGNRTQSEGDVAVLAARVPLISLL